MDRAIILKHLAQAERHVAQGRQIIEKQETLIVDLERDGHDTADAMKILVTMRQTQALHEEDRDQIMKELEQ